MLEKSHLTPSPIGMASAELAKVMYFLDSLGDLRCIAPGSKEYELLMKYRRREAIIMASVPYSKRHRLSRLAWDQRMRMVRNDRGGASIPLRIRAYEKAHPELPKGGSHEAY